jgi:hypothetical protein
LTHQSKSGLLDHCDGVTKKRYGSGSKDFLPSINNIVRDHAAASRIKMEIELQLAEDSYVWFCERVLRRSSCSNIFLKEYEALQVVQNVAGRLY